jgi:uncharacterized protein YjiS (DUF1127 family)
MDIFERAARAKLRFSSAVGDLITEQLFDLPLKAKRASAADLDSVAKDVSRALKAMTEESFVDEKPDARRTELELMMEVVKHVIESKKADIARAEKAAATLERKRKLFDALAQKDDQALAGMTREQIEAEIAALGAGEGEAKAA